MMEARSMTVMQLLAALNGQVAIVERHGTLDRMVTSVTDDSRAVASGGLFIAVKGERVDGHRYVGQAIEAGAAAIVGQESVEHKSLPFVKVVDSRKALGLIGGRFYSDPSVRLTMIGVTGTNGKTTTTYLCKASAVRSGSSEQWPIRLAPRPFQLLTQPQVRSNCKDCWQRCVTHTWTVSSWKCPLMRWPWTGRPDVSMTPRSLTI